MTVYDVRFQPEAEADLFRLYDFIEGESGTLVAGGYLDRIE